MQWRILDNALSGPGFGGAMNMAIDEAILSEIEAGRSPPTVRVYGWTPACVSLGHSQKALQELDLERVHQLGYDVVIRPTGGRAVLHIGELTYSLIAANRSEPWCATQAMSYRTISQAVAQSLAGEGFGVSLDRGYPVERPQALRAMTPCFSSTARSEVVFGERKVVGSAQRRLRSAFLQHGSILVSQDHRKMVECLNLDGEKRARYLEILDRNAISLEEALGRPVTWQGMAAGFESRFTAALGLDARRDRLTEAEAGLISKSVAARMAVQEEWMVMARSGKTEAPKEGKIHA
ncbi:MAG: lipoate--protein ligase family protein [Fibrobacterota bacterium]|nr:lipoate--protein ligase family protein [Fibrobacterota bacterium]